MVFGNIIAKKGGILDDPILNRKDPYYVSDQMVKGFSSQGLNTGDAVSFVVPFKNGITKESLSYIKWFTDQVKQEFEGYGVLSLSVAAHYQDTGTELINEPHINEVLLQKITEDPHWDMQEWKRKVKADEGVYGLLIGRDFNYAVINLLLPSHYDEIGIFRQMAGFLEQRHFPAWQWYFKTDIYPTQQFRDILPAGYVVARGLLDAALLSDVIKLSSLGLIIVGVAFFFSFISLRQAIMATSVVLICFIWVRGSIGIAQWLGINLYERVYFLLVNTAIIVSGISFTERKFNFYNSIRREFPHISVRQAWQQTSPVHYPILITAAIAMLNFATLYQINIRGILEVGVFSALGILFLLILVLWFLPALHTLIGGEAGNKPLSRADKYGHAWNNVMETAVKGCYKIVNPYPEQTSGYKKRSVFFLCITVLLAVGAAGIIGLDYMPFIKKDFNVLEVKTNSLEYIQGTIVHRASRFLNEPSNCGFDRISVAVVPKHLEPGSACITDPRFLSRADRFCREAAKLDSVREVNSALDTVKVISRESYKNSIPSDSRQAHDIFQTIAWDLGPLIKEQLWFDNGLVFFISAAMEDSNKTGKLCSDVIALGREEFPDLDILPFNKLAMYPQTDKYIREGKPWNMVNSQWIIIVICAFWVFRRNRNNIQRYRLTGWRTGLVMSVPFVFASSAIALLMVILRVPLDQATACITALTINAAIDFSLYLIYDYQTALLRGKDVRDALRYALADKGKIILVDIILNVLCFAPLLASSFIPVMRLGWIMMVMLLASGFGALVIMPSLLPWCVADVKNRRLL